MQLERPQENHGKFGTGDKFIAMIRSFHERMQARVSGEVETFITCSVRNGVNQDTNYKSPNTVLLDVVSANLEV